MAIRQFVHTGGLLIADYRAASMNEHGTRSGQGQLSDVFGIQHVKGQTRGQIAEGRSDHESLHLEWETKLHVSVGDETVGVTSGKPLAQSGNVPLLIVNDFGQGKAIFLNLETSRLCSTSARSPFLHQPAECPGGRFGPCGNNGFA